MKGTLTERRNGGGDWRPAARRRRLHLDTLFAAVMTFLVAVQFSVGRSVMMWNLRIVGRLNHTTTTVSIEKEQERQAANAAGAGASDAPLTRSFAYVSYPPSVDKPWMMESGVERARPITQKKGSLSVSVLVPGLAQHAERDFPPLLRSIKEQTEPATEVVIAVSGVHDVLTNSTEGDEEKQGAEWCRSFHRQAKSLLKDTSVRIICIGVRLPAGTARNIAARIAHGDLFVFIDSDDRMLPHRNQIVRNVFECQPSLKLFLHAFEREKKVHPYVLKHNMSAYGFLPAGGECAQDEEGIQKLVDHDFRNNIRETKQSWGRWYPQDMHPGHIVTHRSVFDHIQFTTMPRGQDQVFLWLFFSSFWDNGTAIFLNRPLTTYYKIGGRGRQKKEQ